MVLSHRPKELEQELRNSTKWAATEVNQHQGHHAQQEGEEGEQEEKEEEEEVEKEDEEENAIL